MELSTSHTLELKQAKQLLEHPGLVARLSDIVGMPIEKAMEFLPDSVSGKISSATQAALENALKIVLKTMDASSGDSFPRLHSAAVAMTGAAGGAFGLMALPVELPISTIIMLRSIADIARANGESLVSIEAQLACLMVFSLGGKASADDASESGYFAVRAGLAKAVSEATTHIAEKGFTSRSAPALLRFVSQIATRFNIQVSQKAAATAVPVIGAMSGALINTLFIGHFQDMARGHFTVRRLERIYDKESIKTVYDDIAI